MPRAPVAISSSDPGSGVLAIPPTDDPANTPAVVSSAAAPSTTGLSVRAAIAVACSANRASAPPDPPDAGDEPPPLFGRAAAGRCCRGVVAAPVSGDMDKGPSRFFLKYPAGFVTPSHHHSADHYATIISGSITLTAAGREQKLGPGSYFALTGKASHVARVEGKEEAVFFIEADGPWDVVMDK